MIGDTVSDLESLEAELKEAKKKYRRMLELLYVQEITQTEHDIALSEYLRLTKKVRFLRNK